MGTGPMCCGQCFGDRGLTDSIIPSISKTRGQCSYCLTPDVALAAPQQLRDNFELVISTYELDAAGKPLVEWMKADWDMFHHPRMDNSRAKDLLAEILDDGEIVRQSFSPSARYSSDHLTRWEELRAELMHRNRYFPAVAFDQDRLGRLLANLPAVDMTTKWFRARLQTGDSPFTIADMGAPPQRSVAVGRANPSGIPYLYLGSTPETSISELRPHTGEIASVADFTVPDSMNIVDLRSPRRLVSPFLLTDENEIGLMRSDIAFLERLGEELTRPVVPYGASIDYVPSQYLCEFIKKCSYAGVLYRSSVADGMNLALFDPTIAVAGAVVQYRVTKVTVEVLRS